jgi:hypothetical protein
MKSDFLLELLEISTAAAFICESPSASKVTHVSKPLPQRLQKGPTG